MLLFFCYLFKISPISDPDQKVLAYLSVAPMPDELFEENIRISLVKQFDRGLSLSDSPLWFRVEKAGPLSECLLGRFFVSYNYFILIINKI